MTLLVLALLSILLIGSLRWVNPIGSMLMVERRLEAGSASFAFKRQWQNLDEISPYLQLAVIAAEDQNFPSHHGFDMEAIKAALVHNEKGKTIYGASTISQQVAKNIFLWSGRSWFRKGLEVWFTAWIELLWSKQRILEIYLNSVEWGDGIFGAQAATQFYFSGSTKNLTRQQASLLAAVLPNPRRLSVSEPTDYIKKRAKWIQIQMSNLGGVVFLEKLKE